MKLEDQIKRVHEICGSWGMYEEGQSSEIKQLLYAAGEAGELAIAIAKNDIEGIKDGIGDTLVCLINAERLNFDLCSSAKVESACQQEMHPINEIGYLISKIGSLIDEIAWGEESCGDEGYRSACGALINTAKSYNLTIEECLQQAINEISKRTGKFVNGVFVKDQK